MPTTKQRNCPATGRKPPLAASFLAAVLAVWPGAAAGKDMPYFLLPGAAYLHGVGPIYGGVAGGKDLFAGSADLAAFKTFGEVESGGLILGDLHPFSEDFTAGLGFGLLEKADFKTSYARGFDEADAVRQVMKGSAAGGWLSYDAIPRRLTVFGSYAYSTLAFVDYKTPSGTVIPIRKADLHDVNSQTTSVGLRAEVFPALKEASRRLSLQSKFTSIMGRVGQSDVGLIDLRVKGSQPLSRRWSLAYMSRLQRGFILSPAGSSAVDGDCARITDADLRNRCRLLEGDLTRFIAQSNRVGTGLPLGGSRGLRSFRELRYKAANTALSGLEVSWEFYPELAARLVGFYELGHASDALSNLYARSRRSAGLGARLTYGQVPIRFEWATGEEGRAFFLTFGLPW